MGIYTQGQDHTRTSPNTLVSGGSYDKIRFRTAVESVYRQRTGDNGAVRLKSHTSMSEATNLLHRHHSF